MYDYYELLGVSSLASQDQIARAYRRSAVAQHRSRVIQLKDRLELMQKALQTLSDPERRARYDELRDAVLTRGAQTEDARLRREGRIRVKTAREIARSSTRLGADAVAAHAATMRAIADEHELWELREARRLRRAAMLRLAARLVLAVAATLFAWYVLRR